MKRPFENYRAAITDPDYFDGRAGLIDGVVRSPLDVRILIGGRRLGKTSVLHALEWSLMNPGAGTFNAAFPIYINFKKERPVDIENLFYIIILRLRDCVTRWKRLNWQNLRKSYLEFLGQVSGAEAQIGAFLKLKIDNPDYSRRLTKDAFEQALWQIITELREDDRHGICFLFDEGDYFVSKAWADEAFSYLRALKDASDPMSPFIGLILSGYKGVKNYKQRIGSALYNIGTTLWLCVFEYGDSMSVIRRRGEFEGCPLKAEQADDVIRLAGGHPYLTQQLVTYFVDNPDRTDADRMKLIGTHKQDFLDWWNAAGDSVGLGDAERAAYRALVKRGTASVSTIAEATRVSEFNTFDSLEELMATGLVRRVDESTFSVGSGLFADWVTGQLA